MSAASLIATGIKVKTARERMVGERIELAAHHQPPNAIEPYERLLEDAANGDATLFARDDSVEASWRIVERVLDNATPVYEPNTWGPAGLARSVTPGGGWRAPMREEVSP